MKLFHVSETPGIAVFEPRPAGAGASKVWAIESRTLPNYLLPRDCPRVCFRPGQATNPADLSLLEGAGAIVVVETAWLDRVRAATLFLYDMPPVGFTLEDHNAGYWTTRQPVTPVSFATATDLPARILEAGARLVVRDRLWPLFDRVRDSSLAFSMIRMRNAAPR